MISYKYNIYHSKKTKYLDKMLRECCFVWNHALALQRRYYKLFGKYISVGKIQKHFSKRIKRNLLHSQTVQEILYTRLTNGILLPKLVNVAALIKDCRYATARGYARRAAQSTTVTFLQPVIYFGRAFPNWRARVIPTIAISGFLAFVSKNPIRFSDGSMSKRI